MNKRSLFSTLSLLLISGMLCTSCAENIETETQTESETASAVQTTAALTDAETKEEEPEMGAFTFHGTITKEVLNNYLDRAVTMSCEYNEMAFPKAQELVDFILNTGAKYICRAATAWSPSKDEEAKRSTQTAFIDKVHETDPYVVFEACIFENITKSVNEIKIPAYVFEAFGKEAEDRCFSYDSMIFQNGYGKNQWGTDASVPDITRTETQMFFYYRACGYIDAGFEALHLGQVHLIGHSDTKWRNWTKVLTKIREYAKDNARRGFVFLNAHTHGIIDANGNLMFDFHMYPSRPRSDSKQKRHSPSEEAQNAYFRVGYSDSIYKDSLGGTTYSGWKCDSLPYLVELDNFGDSSQYLNRPTTDGLYVWGMDEITWFANQNAEYRAEFLKYAYQWVTEIDPGLSHFAMPCLRVARIYDTDNNITAWIYNGCTGNGFDDEETVKKIWSENPIG